MSAQDPLKITGAQVRRTFLDFFAARGHTIVPSASLIPADDPTLLFSNSGMVQFKDVFLGTGRRPYTRAADSQKCMRVAGKHNDLDDVGRDGSHHTFFEMLGNWSFGDYYKKDAITWAWQLLTEVWNLPKQRLWATCFEDDHGLIARDDEAANYWLQQPGFDPNHLLFFGRAENFWEMAELGPCGPDSEIHFDLGLEHCKMRDFPKHLCQVNGDCGRFLELWNLVFIQYNRIGPTNLEALPSKHVDTGMGLERIVSLLQDSQSNYLTDLFSPLLDTVQHLSGHTDDERESNITAYRVVADHIRAATFLIADGVIPGNTGRNYVCRMIIRRASRFGTQVGFTDPFLSQVAKTVIEEYGDSYPEILRNRALILRTLTDEELRFHRTVDLGLSQLNTLIDDLNQRQQTQLPGAEAFELYATYGLPLEITRDILNDHELGVEDGGFERAMDTHRVASGAGIAMGDMGSEQTDAYTTLLEELQEEDTMSTEGVEHNPYGGLEIREPLLALLSDGTRVDSAVPGDMVEVVILRTPFYVESGGQVSDSGTITFDDDSLATPKWEIKITDARRPIGALVTHQGEVVAGNQRQGDSTVARIDPQRRSNIMRNHTATHLLHAGLRSVIGDHVRQSGSLVAPDRLRFDFTHDAALTDAELDSLSKTVNNAILANLPVTAEYQHRDEAIACGAIALFGEKYGDVVRTIKIFDGAEQLSLELCGGTHVHRTGDIGLFVVLSDGSVAAGVRRIEAVTGHAALGHITQRLSVLKDAATHLQVSPDDVARKALSVIRASRALQATLSTLQMEQAQHQFELALEGTTEIHGVVVLSAQVDVAERQLLRKMTDWFRQRIPSGVSVFGANIEGKPNLIAAVTKDLTLLGLHAGNLVGEVSQLVGGQGGGNATLGQAGGNNTKQLANAIACVPDLVAKSLAAHQQE